MKILRITGCVVLLVGIHLTALSRVAVFPGDAAFLRMEYAEAVRQYDSVLHVIAPHPDLLWRIARAHIAMGDVTEGAERIEHYNAAVEYSRHCVALDSTSADGYAWLAASLGSIAMDAGSKQKVRLANDIKRSLDRAVALDPKNDVAWSILGTFYRSLGGIGWIERRLADLLLGTLPPGGYEESERAFLRAVELAPQTVRHRFELALLYEATDRPALAAQEYRQCLLLPPQMSSDRRRQAEARKWLERNQPALIPQDRVNTMVLTGN